MPTGRITNANRKQRGQTLVLVAISLVVLVSMAALAIDLTTLYVARTEMQRAADAAALAGAEAFVDSGTTTDASDPTLQALATNMANQFVAGVVARNSVGGVTPQLVSSPIDFSRLGDPQITVTLQRTDVPTFFARIFGRRLATVRASATAEAYNSSNPGGTAGAASMPPVAPTCVKPWLVVNNDPKFPGTPFVNTANGSVGRPGYWSTPGPPAGPLTCAPGGTGGVVGECMTLAYLGPPTPPSPLPPGYLPARLSPTPPSPTSTCPNCAAGQHNFVQSIACCDTVNAAQYSCGSPAPVLDVDSSDDRGDTISGAACLANVPGGGAGIGEDTIDFTGFPGGPIQITAGDGPHIGNLVTTSNQIITLPIISTTVTGAPPQATIVGFMQAFITGTTNVPSPATLTLYVINISGCGPNVNRAATPVSGGGVSPVPVRLIQP